MGEWSILKWMPIGASNQELGTAMNAKYNIISLHLLVKLWMSKRENCG